MNNLEFLPHFFPITYYTSIFRCKSRSKWYKNDQQLAQCSKMLLISISCDTMNSTSQETNQSSTTNSDLYLLIIVIKLSIFVALKIGQTLMHLYSWHEKRVIDKHNRITVAKLQEITSRANDNLETGLPRKSN